MKEDAIRKMLDDISNQDFSDDDSNIIFFTCLNYNYAKADSEMLKYGLFRFFVH